MKIRLTREIIAKGLLGFIGAQAVFVAGSLYQRYWLPKTKVIEANNKTVFRSQEDILYGAITCDRNSIEPVWDEGKELHITFAGMTSATTVSATFTPSGDIPHSSMDFPV